MRTIACDRVNVRMLKMTGFKHTITQALDVEMGSTMCSDYMSVNPSKFGGRREIEIRTRSWGRRGRGLVGHTT